MMCQLLPPQGSQLCVSQLTVEWRLPMSIVDSITLHRACCGLQRLYTRQNIQDTFQYSQTLFDRHKFPLKTACARHTGKLGRDLLWAPTYTCAEAEPQHRSSGKPHIHWQAKRRRVWRPCHDIRSTTVVRMRPPGARQH